MRNFLFKLLSFLFLYIFMLEVLATSRILIKDGTIINTDWNGSNKDDIKNGFILIENGKIKLVTTFLNKISCDKSTKVINARGKYIIPGLIDGFAVINNQDYANAFLLSGVTSVIGVESDRRGKLFESASPSPEIFKLGDVGETVETKDEIKRDFKNLANQNVRVMLLMYKLTPWLLRYSLNLARKYNMGCIGELGFTSYQKAIQMGIRVFVHDTRYSLGLAPKKMAVLVAKEPFSDDLNSPKWRYYKYLSKINVKNDFVIKYAKKLATTGVYLMPTLSLLYLDLPKHKNPWKEKVSKLIDEKDINNPADKITGNHKYTKVMQEAYTKLAIKMVKLEQLYYSCGARYLTGSACDVWGTMPGISLHTELELLKRVGLTNRQLLASATSNFHKVFGWKKGIIKKGYDADILILNANPLKNMKNLKKIHMLLLKGKVINLKSLWKVSK